LVREGWNLGQDNYFPPTQGDPTALAYSGMLSGKFAKVGGKPRKAGRQTELGALGERGEGEVRKSHNQVGREGS
jgi:hypothetical protein